MSCILGIVDEDVKQQRKIRRTIKANVPPEREEPNFKEYIGPKNQDYSFDQIMDEIESDVFNHRIDGLIIDYALVMPSVDLRGTDIYKRLNGLVPKLPVILLTNYPEPCHDLDYIDADKIYPKGKFFKIEDSYSKDKVGDLLENASKYSLQRAKLQQAFENEMNKFEEDNNDFERYSHLVSLEDELAQFAPQDPSTSTGNLNIERLCRAVELIDQAFAIMKEQDD